MPGRHVVPGRHSASARANSRALIALLIGGVALAVGLGGFVITNVASSIKPVVAGCGVAQQLVVAATPETVEVLESVADSLARGRTKAAGTCVDFHVEAVPPAKVSRAIDARTADVPDLWVPDSSAWVDRVKKKADASLVVAKSLAASPVVVADGRVSKPRSWLDVMSRPNVSFVDPLRNSAPTAALLALRAEQKATGASDQDLDAVMLPLAQRLGAEGDAPSRLTDLALDTGGTAILSEQQLLALRERGLAGGLKAAVPRTGTLVLDYPVVALTEDSTLTAAAQLLVERLQSEEGRSLLAEEGFRTADLEPLPDGLGAGEIKVLEAPDADVAATMLRRWSVLTVPSRILGVFDVSRSMDRSHAGRTRIALAVSASRRALQSFPDRTRMGVWAFSIHLGQGNRDYRELVPVRELRARVRGHNQRQLLSQALARLPRMTSGGTGLYDSTLAAVRALRKAYDGAAINSVVLLTDGENDDSSSVTLPKLVRTLQQERDPSRPVSVIAVGVGPDADAAALRRIVAATGGRHYVARKPEDISRVLGNALRRH